MCVIRNMSFKDVEETLSCFNGKRSSSIAVDQSARYIASSSIKQKVAFTLSKLEKGSNWISNMVIQIMTVQEQKAGKLIIHYEFYTSSLGNLMIAATMRGICYLGFVDEQAAAVAELERRFPGATHIKQESEHHKNALDAIEGRTANTSPIRLHLKGTSFQISIWKKLLEIPLGGLVTYASLTNDVKNARAVGAAVGDNPIGYLIPCHRVVRTDGTFNQYYWGPQRKAALVLWEAMMENEKTTSQETGFQVQQS